MTAKTAGKAPAAKAAKGKSAKKGSKSAAERPPVNRIAVMLTLAALVPFSLPTLLLLFVGMLPTLVAVVAERGVSRYAWIAVGGLNFSGLAPWLFKLWFGNHTMAFAIDQILGITMLLAAYGAAAGGWLLYMCVPPAVQAVLSITSHRRRGVLVGAQKKLEEEWGQGVVAIGGEGQAQQK